MAPWFPTGRWRGWAGLLLIGLASTAIALFLLLPRSPDPHHKTSPSPSSPSPPPVTTLQDRVGTPLAQTPSPPPPTPPGNQTLPLVRNATNATATTAVGPKGTMAPITTGRDPLLARAFKALGGSPSSVCYPMDGKALAKAIASRGCPMIVLRNSSYVVGGGCLWGDRGRDGMGGSLNILCAMGTHGDHIG
jgi:hypothetical protein